MLVWGRKREKKVYEKRERYKRVESGGEKERLRFCVKKKQGEDRDWVRKAEVEEERERGEKMD